MQTVSICFSSASDLAFATGIYELTDYYLGESENMQMALKRAFRYCPILFSESPTGILIVPQQLSDIISHASFNLEIEYRISSLIRCFKPVTSGRIAAIG